MSNKHQEMRELEDSFYNEITMNQFSSFWAKKSDTELHIVDPKSSNVGSGVMCGKYGALLGNNYAKSLTDSIGSTKVPICSKCLEEVYSRLR